MNKTIGVMALASALLAAPAFGQAVGTVNAPIALNSSGQPVSATPVINVDPANGNPITPPAAPTTYPLLTNATPATASTPPAGDYNVLFPPTLGGSTFSVAQLSNGSTTTRTWTAAQIAAMIYPPCIPVSAGDIISASVTGGTPTGNTVFAGVTRCGSGDVSPALIDTVIKATTTDRGIVVTTAGTAQQIMSANTSRRGFAVQNQSSGACYINGNTTATQDYHSLQIAAGAYYETPPTNTGTGAISIVCAFSSASVYAREW